MYGKEEDKVYIIKIMIVRHPEKDNQPIKKPDWMHSKLLIVKNFLNKNCQNGLKTVCQKQIAQI